MKMASQRDTMVPVAVKIISLSEDAVLAGGSGTVRNSKVRIGCDNKRILLRISAHNRLRLVSCETSFMANLD